MEDTGVIKAIKERRSVRDFQARDVSEEKIRALVSLGNQAPSAGNLQARDFVVVRDKRTKNKLVDCAFGQEFVGEAPVVIVVCANQKRIRPYGERGRSLYSIQDAAAAAENILLAARSMGLGGCWVCTFDEARAASLLSLPSHARPVALMPLGYPRTKGEQTSRHPLDEVMHHEKW